MYEEKSPEAEPSYLLCAGPQQQKVVSVQSSFHSSHSTEQKIHTFMMRESNGAKVGSVKQS